MSDLYETDVVEWAERQAKLLRGLADRQPSNEVPDWHNIIEELEDVGRSQLRSVESLLMRALLHDLKAQAWPYAQQVPHWRSEARVFRRDARHRLTPSMHHKIDVASLFRDALESLPETMDGYPPCKKCLAVAIVAQPTNLDEALADMEDSDDPFDKP